MADSKNRRPQTDFQNFGGPGDWGNTGAKDRSARANKGDIKQDNSAREAARGAAGFEGSFIDVGNTAKNPSSTANSGGSKGESV